jgi:hypothetical protein
MNGYSLKNFQSLFTDDLNIHHKQVETVSSNVLKHLELHAVSIIEDNAVVQSYE